VQTHERVIVIASGPSGAGPWLEHPGVPVIAVAGAVEGLGFVPDYWFTIDPTPINMARLAGLSPNTLPILAVPWDFGAGGTHEEKFKQNFGRAHLLCLDRNVGMTADRRILGVGNSGRAAVQLAMHMGARRIAVFGVDGTADGHWHDPSLHSGNLKSLGRGCAELRAPGVDIVFADSGRSTVEGQTRATPEATLAWVTSQR
jgi:hypothetical protein